ncbi:MAG: C4-dicarboxylate transporter [Rhizobacter sp.]|nr:C4-dicarboxylate transporter [Rhizobacter sp.]
MDINVPGIVSAPSTPRSFAWFPVGLFGSVMGLTGLSVAWHLAHDRFGLSIVYSEAIGILAIIVFVAVFAGYAAKIVSAPDAARAEFAHPIAGNLFGTILISLLLLPIVVAPLNLGVARALWALGAGGMVAFGWFMVDRWMNHRQQAAHATPVWIIPVVGMLDLPLAMPALGLQAWHGVMVLGLAVGLFFTVPLFTMIFSRLIFEERLPDTLQASLLILLAPFAVGTSTYIVTVGRVDVFAESLFALTLFLLAVLLGRLRYLARCCPFRVAWWAVSFPLAASAIAAFRIAAADGGPAADAVAIALLALSTIVIAGLLVRTLVGVIRGELASLSS